MTQAVRNFSVYNRQGNTRLHHIEDKAEDIQHSVEKDIQNLQINVNIQNPEGYTGVHLAIQNKMSEVIVQVLIFSIYMIWRFYA